MTGCLGIKKSRGSTGEKVNEAHFPLDSVGAAVNAWQMIDPQLLDLYSTRLKDLGAQVKEDRPLPDAAASVKRRSPLCGSEVTFDIALDDHQCVAAIGYSVRACSLAQAATAIVVNAAVGTSLEEARDVRDAVRKMLRENSDELPQGKWSDLDVLKPAQMVPARHGSALLPFDTLVKVIEKARKNPSGCE